MIYQFKQICQCSLVAIRLIKQNMSSLCCNRLYGPCLGLTLCLTTAQSSLVRQFLMSIYNIICCFQNLDVLIIYINPSIVLSQNLGCCRIFPVVCDLNTVVQILSGEQPGFQNGGGGAQTPSTNIFKYKVNKQKRHQCFLGTLTICCLQCNQPKPLLKNFNGFAPVRWHSFQL